MKLKAVFFDMGGTIETFGYTRNLRMAATPEIRQFLMRAGIDLSRLDDAQLYEAISTGLQRYKRWSIQSMEELPAHRIWTDYVFAGLEVDPAPLAAIAEALMVEIETRFYQRAIRPEVPQALQAIQAMGLKMGIISNIASRGLVPANLKAYGIDHYFNPVVLSSEYGRRKPDPAIFHYAARLAEVPTSACLYIGDRVARDIEGACRAGFAKAIQIRHDFQHGEDDSGMAPDAVIENMMELVDILRAEQDCPPPPPTPGKVKALIFDAGDVLYFRAERGARFSAFLNELGLQISPTHAQDKKAIEYKAYRGQITHDEYRQAVVGLYGITQPDQVALGKQALIDDDANVSFFEGVPETLLALKAQGCLLAIVTDTANSVSAKLDWFGRGGFGHIWDSIISSLEIGTRKPDPRIYQAALQQLGVAPNQAAFVGHRAAELSGARAVGMHTIAFNYDPEAQADFFIEKFEHLLTLPAVNGGFHANHL